jgi:hypothetical protein
MELSNDPARDLGRLDVILGSILLLAVAGSRNLSLLDHRSFSNISRDVQLAAPKVTPKSGG